ncbi:MAG: SRPBCC family protein [Verrucomicrobiota bacterium]|nr:SRPBCC family protein [Verrucomicrobiota bacterium]
MRSAVALLELESNIRAPIARVFDLSRSIDLHVVSTAKTGERAIAGVTSGLIGLHQQVTWRARHFGVWQTFTSKITQFERPFYFRDTMVRGIFARFAHDHRFFETASGTSMRDTLDFKAPLGFLGRIAEVCVLENYLRRLLRHRNEVIQVAAESEQWRDFL